VIPTMDLVEVDIIGLQTLQPVINLGEDGLARQTLAVWIGAHLSGDLRGEHDFVPLGEVLERAPGNLFADADGIDVGCIEEVDPRAERLLEEGAALFVAQNPGAVLIAGIAAGHAAEADARDFEAALAEIDVLHGITAPFRT